MNYGYGSDKNYAPPPGPPPVHHGYAPPQGPPPPQSRYVPPPGPPTHYTPPFGSPPPQTGFAPPPGPPPTQFGLPPPYNPSGYPGQGYHHGGYPNPGQSYNQYGSPPPGGWPGRPAAPPMAPPEGNQTFGPPTAGGNQRFYRYSQCSGKKKALCIGINYIGQENQLGGCINDALNMRNFLCRHYGYKMEDIVLLRDDSQNPKELPTKDNMLRAMQWLVSDPRPNDSLFFHFDKTKLKGISDSGHGGQTQDLNGDEDDGFDEVIYPVDYKKRGHIVDDDLHEIMVKPLPPGCRLTAIFDSCHSGTALDLPYVYSTEGKIKEPNLMAEAGKGALSVFTAYERHNILGAVKGAVDLVKVATGNTRQAQAQRTTRQTKTSPADAISWGGCKDSQTSADTQEAGRATGAMSYAFITSLEQNPQQTYQQLLVNIRNILSGKYSQKPQLSCSHPMDTNILFIC